MKKKTKAITIYILDIELDIDALTNQFVHFFFIGIQMQCVKSNKIDMR